jgi:hypothetical protein
MRLRGADETMFEIRYRPLRKQRIEMARICLGFSLDDERSSAPLVSGKRDFDKWAAGQGKVV